MPLVDVARAEFKVSVSSPGTITAALHSKLQGCRWLARRRRHLRLVPRRAVSHCTCRTFSILISQ